MPQLTINVPHQLTQQEALHRITSLISNLKAEQKDKISNVTEHWVGNTGSFGFTAYGYDLSGTIQVHDSSIDIDAKVPFAVSLFKGTIQDIIHKKAAELLS
jgi:hypothetical protein